MAPSIPWRSRKRRATSPPCTAEYGGGRPRTRAAVYREQLIPPEIITNILKRLPVKSIIRFQCVCKDWKNLIKTPFFIAEHLSHSTLQNDCLVFKSGSYQSNPGRLRLINRDMKVLEHHTPSSVGGCSIAGSSNGLLCLSSESFILWNPATREVLRVPQEPHLVDHFMIDHEGFGFSPIINDYKIVRLSLSSPFDGDDQVYIVQVFSVSTWSWKEVEAGKLEGIIPYVSTSGFTFDGAIFWFGLGFKPGGNEPEDWLISFDIATESFTLIPIPRSAHVSDNSRLATHENKLTMLSKVGDEYRTGMRIDESFWINLWVVEKCIDESGERWTWTKIYSVNPYPYGVGVSILETIWRNEIFGEAIVDKDVRKLFKCSVLTNEFKTLGIGKYNIGTQIWNYAESLVSPKALCHLATFTIELTHPKS